MGDVPEISDVPTKRGNTRCITHLHFFSANYIVLPRDLRRRSAAARSMGLRVRIQPRPWMSVSYECCGLSGIGLCDGPIICPEESYWVLCVCDHEASRNVEAIAYQGLSNLEKTKTAVTDTLNKWILATTSIDRRLRMCIVCKVGHCKHVFKIWN